MLHAPGAAAAADHRNPNDGLSNAFLTSTRCLSPKDSKGVDISSRQTTVRLTQAMRAQSQPAAVHRRGRKGALAQQQLQLLRCRDLALALQRQPLLTHRPPLRLLQAHWLHGSPAVTAAALPRFLLLLRRTLQRLPLRRLRQVRQLLQRLQAAVRGTAQQRLQTRRRCRHRKQVRCRRQ